MKFMNMKISSGCHCERSEAINLSRLLRSLWSLATALRKHDSAETLIEVISCIIILIILIPSVYNMLQSSGRTRTDNRNNLIAMTLAEEGIVITKNIISTNILKFAAKTSQCWDAKPEPESVNSDNCHELQNKLQSGSYRLAINLNANSPGYLKWTLQSALSAEPLHSGVLGAYDLAGPHDSFYRLKLHPNLHIYNYEDNGGEETGFFREIQIAKSNMVSPPQGPAWTDGDDMISITSIVAYHSGAPVHSVKRTIDLFKPSS